MLRERSRVIFNISTIVNFRTISGTLTAERLSNFLKKFRGQGRRVEIIKFIEN